MWQDPYDRMAKMAPPGGDGYGLYGDDDGLYLGPGIALVKRQINAEGVADFAVRPQEELDVLLHAAYGMEVDLSRRMSILAAVANALQKGEWSRAMISAAHLQLPPLSDDAAVTRLCGVDQLLKYNFNPDEPRDWHGRWTYVPGWAEGHAKPERDRGGPVARSDAGNKSDGRGESSTPNRIDQVSDAAAEVISGWAESFKQPKKIGGILVAQADTGYMSDGDYNSSAPDIFDQPSQDSNSESKDFSDPAKTEDGRPLTEGEIRLARSVIREEIDYSKVRVRNYGWQFIPGLPSLQPSDVAMSPDGNIYFTADNEAYRADFSQAPIELKALFLHEMMHVWQKQHGIEPILGFAMNHEYELEPGKKWEKYLIEQQASIVADYFLVINGYKPRRSKGSRVPTAKDYEDVIPFKN